MNIVLIAPPCEYMNRLPPLGLAYLASYIRKRGYENTIIIDSDIMQYSIDETVEKALSANPDIVGVTVMTSSYNYALQIAAGIKKKRSALPVIFGGTHSSALPEYILKNPCVDMVCAGEGEHVFYNLLQTLKQGKSPAGVRGLVYKEGDRIVKNEPEPFISDLDSLPFPDRSILPLEKYTTAGSSLPSGKYMFTTLVTSRGCPFHCIYCASKTTMGGAYRFRSADNIIREIEEIIKNYKIRHFRILDDIFTLKKERVLAFCDEIVKRKLRIVWECFSRIDLVDETILKALKAAGCYTITYGLESGSQTILNNLKKGTTVKKAEEIVALTKKIGIRISANFMIGNPGETKETIEETIRFAKKMKIDSLGVAITTPYPGTELFLMFQDRLKEPIDWDAFMFTTYDSDNPRRPFVSCCGMNTKELYENYLRASKKINLQMHFVLKRFLRIKSMKEFTALFKRAFKLLLNIK